MLPVKNTVVTDFFFTHAEFSKIITKKRKKYVLYPQNSAKHVSSISNSSVLQLFEVLFKQGCIKTACVKNMPLTINKHYSFCT